MGEWRPKRLYYHDWGGNPANQEGMRIPYHAVVFPDGSKRYRDPVNPYGAPAEHSYADNRNSIGLAYAGQVGSTPTEAALAALRAENEAIKQRFPDIQGIGHGEAYHRHKSHGDIPRPTKTSRDLVEASWRSNLTDPYAGTGYKREDYSKLADAFGPVDPPSVPTPQLVASGTTKSPFVADTVKPPYTGLGTAPGAAPASPFGALAKAGQSLMGGQQGGQDDSLAKAAQAADATARQHHEQLKKRKNPLFDSALFDGVA